MELADDLSTDVLLASNSSYMAPFFVRSIVQSLEH